MFSSLLKRVLRAQAGPSVPHIRLQLGYSHLLGDDLPGAIAIAAELLAKDPELVGAHLLLAQAAAAGGQWDDALASIERILVCEPRHAEAHYVRGMLHQQRNNPVQAIADFTQVLASDPSHADALERKGALHDARGEFEDALACAQRLLELDPQNARAFDKLGITLRELGRLDEAASVFQRALDLDGGLHSARSHLALVRTDQARFQDAEAELETVLAAQTNDQDARWTRAVCSLLQGHYETAWDDYEWRDARRKPRSFLAGIPEWDGTGPQEGALLVYAEQGLGDQIMFASCLPDVLARSPACIVECDPKLQSLLQRSFPDAAVVASPSRRPDDWIRSLPLPVAAQVGLGSLPRFFRRSRSAFPAHDGYLQAYPAGVARWRKRLEALGPGLKVGLGWTGGTAKTRQRLRSMSLEQLLPLFRAGACQFVNLQYVDSAAEIAVARDRHGVQVHDFEDAGASYDETAALVGSLDLVVSVCTAVVHLAGALGKTVWIMTPAAPEWRYLAAGARIPWYPAARVWRQRRLGDWDELIAAIAAELAIAAGSGSERTCDQG